MTTDAWDQVRFETFDELVTWVKLNGSCLQLNAYTTPEGWPVSVLIAVGKPGNERVIEIVKEAGLAIHQAGASVQAAVNDALPPHPGNPWPTE
jgi:hypothetical protein